jgi:hypothetical protein
MNKLMGLFFLLIILPVFVMAEQNITEHYFSYKAVLKGGKNSLRQVELPQSVLQGMSRSDLGDLRIFSAEGQIVPHQFMRVVTQNSIQKAALVFYPFTQQQATDPASIRIQIQQQNGQQRIDVQSDQAKKQGVQGHNEFQYIIENSISQKKAKKPLCSLRLNWQQPKPSMILPLKIEASNNLQHWSALAQNKNISRLNFAGAQLLRSKIEIPCTRQRYLRLQWLKPEQNIKLIKIEGSYHQNGANKMQWDSLGKPQITKEGDWLFENNSVAPMLSLSFVAPTSGLLYKGLLFARNSPKEKWRQQQSIIQYRLQMGEVALNSEPEPLYNGVAKYWKLQLSSESQFSSEQLPEIKVSRQQQQIIYLAQGAEPFTVAYGNADIAPANHSGINQLIKTLQDTGMQPDIVTLGEVIAITDKVGISSEVAWKVIGLWALLLLGTVLMGFMAYSLYRQMNEKRDLS